VVSHKLHSIIRVGAGLIQFVYGSYTKRGHGAHFIKKSMFAIFSREFSDKMQLLRGKEPMESFCRVVESFAGSNLVEFESANNRSCGVSLTHIAQNNPTKMDKTQDFCSQGFGHQVV